MLSALAVQPDPLRTSLVHVVVLAAGRGSRLGALGEERPKWLLEVSGRTLADRQLEGIRAAESAVASVSVVVGHAAEAIARDVGDREAPIKLIDNPEYESCNNWWSVLRALRELPAGAPVVIINADLLIDPSEVREFIASAAYGTADGLLAADLEQAVTEESMKVSLRPDGVLGQIGKVDIASPAGEYVGLLMARGATLEAFRAELEAFVGRPEHVNEWYEGAVGRSAAAGAQWRLWPVRTAAWVEIDDDRDLRSAEALGDRS
jgi:choline kinase